MPMKVDRKRRIIPRNPFERPDDGDASRFARRVFRLMRKDPSVPVYREIEITEDILRAISDFEAIAIAVEIIDADLRKDGVVHWDALPKREEEPAEIIAGALAALRAEYGDRKPRLDALFIERAHDAIQLQYVKEFLALCDHPTTAQEWYHNANIHSSHGDRLSALLCYGMALSLAPDNPIFLFGRAQCHFMHGHDARSAKTDIESAMLHTRPTNYYRLLVQHLLRAKVYNALANIPETLNSMGASVEIFRHLLEDFEPDAKGWIHLGNGAMINAMTIKETLKHHLDFARSFHVDDMGIECRTELLQIRRRYREFDDML